MKSATLQRERSGRVVHARRSTPPQPLRKPHHHHPRHACTCHGRFCVAASTTKRRLYRLEVREADSTTKRRLASRAPATGP